MRTKWLVWSTGFALFSMFFGSGNLVFPLTVGQESQGHYLLGAVGIILTGVAVPFLGVFGMLLYKGDLNQFFSIFGKRGTMIFSFCLLALMGPFGVLARCLTVAHGALLLIFPNVSLALCSLSMCCLIYFFTVNQHKIVSLLGTVLTPFLLFAIGTIVVFGLQQEASSLSLSPQGEAWASFKNGFFKGYYIMDLLAAFFFSHFIIKHLNTLNEEDETATFAIFLKASLIGASLLSGIYFVLTVMGWTYSIQLMQKPPQEFLGLIAFETLGKFAGPIVCLAVVFACLTTAIILTSLFAEFLKKELCRDKMDYKIANLLTLVIGFSVSILEFEGIAKILGPIVEMIYPGLIALTLFNILKFFYSKKTSGLLVKS
ncbi:Uncharacterized protein PHSC3_001199 [Chlamydiales bacterium STE3]|nr:Uncharacterized protein PHSC3_001199 [Chlamydiales bacterium STE3]